MKLLSVILLSVLTIHAASAGLKLYPEPWCVCGTWYKMKLDPLSVALPGVDYASQPAWQRGVNTYNLDSPAQTMAAMRRAFIDKLENPLGYYPLDRAPPCGYRY